MLFRSIGEGAARRLFVGCLVGAFVAVLPIAVAQPWAALALLAVPLALGPSRAMLTAEDAPALIAALVGTVRLELVAGALLALGLALA